MAPIGSGFISTANIIYKLWSEIMIHIIKYWFVKIWYKVLLPWQMEHIINCGQDKWVFFIIFIILFKLTSQSICTRFIPFYTACQTLSAITSKTPYIFYESPTRCSGDRSLHKGTRTNHIRSYDFFAPKCNNCWNFINFWQILLDTLACSACACGHL